MLGVLERFIDPGFEDFWAHLDLLVNRLEPGVFGLNYVHIVTFASRWAIVPATCSSTSTLRVNHELGFELSRLVYCFLKFLLNDWDIEEALERLLFCNRGVNLGQLKANTVAAQTPG